MLNENTEAISHDEVLMVANNMIEHGGTFIAALGRALKLADETNVAKIRDTWSEDWERYRAIVEVDWLDIASNIVRMRGVEVCNP